MYGICAYIWPKFMVNVGKYTSPMDPTGDNWKQTLSIVIRKTCLQKTPRSNARLEASDATTQFEQFLWFWSRQPWPGGEDFLFGKFWWFFKPHHFQVPGCPSDPITLSEDDWGVQSPATYFGSITILRRWARIPRGGENFGKLPFVFDIFWGMIRRGESWMMIPQDSANRGRRFGDEVNIQLQRLKFLKGTFTHWIGNVKKTCRNI